RRRYIRDQQTHGCDRHTPELDFNRVSGSIGAAHESGLGRLRSGEQIQPIVWRSACPAEQARAAISELMVERHSRKMRAYHRDTDMSIARVIVKLVSFRRKCKISGA